MREDFCGTAAVSKLWVQEALARGERACGCAVDLNPAVVEAATAAGLVPGLTMRCCDAIAAADTDPADVIWVGNFSIGYIFSAKALAAYLRACHARLTAKGKTGGIIACDIYGGASAFRLGSLLRRHTAPGGEIVHYCWTHEAADPLTGMVENSISFKVELAGEGSEGSGGSGASGGSGEIVAEWPRAFEYRWRLWSIAELREAMLEAGFVTSEVYVQIEVQPDVPPRPVQIGTELGDDWAVLLVGRA